ncbi:MAG: hypothetical protein HY268_33550, partial [Deltaproteobacteria bacterium]|nr:hypothetical protein [Deltaproteobacteria bacterium]
MASRTIMIDAESLEEAKKKAKHTMESLTSDGFFLLSEQVVHTGDPERQEVVADTIDAAMTKAESQVPSGARVITRKQLSLPERRLVTVEAFNEGIARARVHAQSSSTAVVRGMRLSVAGRRGLLGIGKRPHRYEVDVFQPSVVEIIYQPKATLSLRVAEQAERIIRGFLTALDSLSVIEPPNKQPELSSRSDLIDVMRFLLVCEVKPARGAEYIKVARLDWFQSGKSHVSIEWREYYWDRSFGDSRLRISRVADQQYTLEIFGTEQYNNMRAARVY